MLACNDFYNMLVENYITFFTGVPDSLLKDFCAYVMDHTDAENHIITANEGNAVALAAGYYLGNQHPGLVYMQNSGLGNAINPLVSLVDPEVYSIPLLLLIGWRGEPGKKDEPQHSKQGKITLQLLQTLGIDHTVLSEETETAKHCLEHAVYIMSQYQKPYALVVREETFLPYKLKKQFITSHQMSRENAIKHFTNWHGEKDIIISTTGKTSRELFECRLHLNKSSSQDFLTVGSMGHASQIALGVALTQPDRQVFCLDGDGALIMHMGSLAIIGNLNIPNFKHIIINNGAHDSVGGQPTVGFNIDIPAIAQACGYTYTSRVKTSEDLIEKLNILRVSRGPALLEVCVNKGARSNLGRPTMTPIENKESLLRFLKG